MVSINGEFTHTDIIEIYKKDDCWYSTERLPFVLTQFTIQMIGDTCYTLGGTPTTYDDSQHSSLCLCIFSS